MGLRGDSQATSNGSASADFGSSEVRKIWRPTTEAGIEVLQIRNTEKRCGMFHERFAISLCQSGTGTVRYRGRTAEHDLGSLFFLEPGEVHSSPAAVGPLGWDVVFVDEPILLAAADHARIRGRMHWRSIVAHDRDAVRIFSQALSAFRDRGDPGATQSALSDLLDVLLRHHAEGGNDAKISLRDTALVRKLRKRLLDQVQEPVSLVALAADFGISVCHMVRCFSAETGVPPHQYLLQLRIERARGLLAHGRPSIEVAHELGFADQSHFHRHFTKLVGVTPGRYARAAR
jgi:AraC-like DNA-binding protein